MNQIKNLISMSAPKQQEGKDPDDAITRHVEPDDNRVCKLHPSTGTPGTDSTEPNQNTD